MRQDLDFALHVGDYIYEYKRGEYNGKRGAVRGHLPKNEIVTLQDYRERYAQYHTDPALQAAHANCPWIVTWDDHEVANDTWAGGAENHTPGREGNFQKRRDAAIQAYLEWLPIRATPFSQGGHIYRNLSFGNLVELNMLDLRTYRNKQMSFLKAKGIDKKNRTMLGSEQFKWLAGKLTTSQAKWNLIGNSVMISPCSFRRWIQNHRSSNPTSGTPRAGNAIQLRSMGWLRRGAPPLDQAATRSQDQQHCLANWRYPLLMGK